MSQSGGAASKEVNDRRIDEQLKGNTLRVYLYLLRAPNGTVGIREVQRALRLSSPTLAAHHLEKLVKLGLVVKESAQYRVVHEVKVGVFRQFLRLGGAFVPRYALYAFMFTALLVFFVSQLPLRIDFYAFFALLFGSSSTAIFWYETFKAWREMPKGE